MSTEYRREDFARLRQISQLLRNVAATQKQLETWAGSADPNVWITLLNSSNTPDAIVERIEQHVLESRNLNPNFLAVLASSERVTVDVLRSVYNEKDWCVCLALANNKNTPVDVLQMLASLPARASHHLKDANAVIREIAKKRVPSKESVDSE